MCRVKRLLPLLVLAAACAHVPEPLPAPEPSPPAPVAAPAVPPDVALLARLRADVDALLEAQAEATWVAWTTAAPLDLASLHAGREWLSDGAALRALDALAPSPDPAEAARRRMLHDFLVGEVLAAAAAPAPGVPAPDLSFQYEGRTVALRDVTSMLAAEPDAARRAALDAARAPSAARAARAADGSANALSAAASKLGMGDAMAVATWLRGAGPEEVAALAASTPSARMPDRKRATPSSCRKARASEAPPDGSAESRTSSGTRTGTVSGRWLFPGTGRSSTFTRAVRSTPAASAAAIPSPTRRVPGWAFGSWEARSMRGRSRIRVAASATPISRRASVSMAAQ